MSAEFLGFSGTFSVTDALVISNEKPFLSE